MQGNSTMKGVFGPDLMREVCRRSAGTGIRHFLCGGNPGIAAELGERLRRRFPGITVVGPLRLFTVLVCRKSYKRNSPEPISPT